MGVSGLLLSSVRTKPRFNPSYERRRCAFVASWLSAAGASTGQGSAQRSAGGGVALTRAGRGGIRRLGYRSPSTLILRGGTASDCRRIFGPSREHARLAGVFARREPQITPRSSPRRRSHELPGALVTHGESGRTSIFTAEGSTSTHAKPGRTKTPSATADDLSISDVTSSP